jgi:hypothetical protein
MVKWIKCAALSAAMALGLAASAQASLTTFNFSDETGINARGKLVLEDYVPSTGSFEQSGGAFVSWQFYLGSVLVHDVTPGNLFSFSSNLDVSSISPIGYNHAVRIESRTTDSNITTTSVFETGLPNTNPLSALPFLWTFRVCDNSGIPCGGGDGPQIDNTPEPTYAWQMVPEPMTWVLMIGGFGLAGAQLRARRRRVA